MNKRLVLVMSCMVSLLVGGYSSIFSDEGAPKKGMYRWAFTVGVDPFQGLPNLIDQPNAYLFVRWNRSPQRSWQAGIWQLSKEDNAFSISSLVAQNYTMKTRLQVGAGVQGIVQYVWRFPLSNKITGYLGVGPLLGWGKWVSKMDYSRDADYRYATTSINRWDAGVSGTFSMEWFFTSYASLNAIFLLRFLVSNETRRQKVWDSANQNTLLQDHTNSEIRNEFSQNFVLLGITLYWGEHLK